MNVLSERSQGMEPDPAGARERAPVSGNTRRSYEAALRFRAGSEERDSPAGPESERALGMFRRLDTGRGYGRVAGISWEEADRACELAERAGDLAGLRDAVIVAVGSDALLRVSELEALDVGDVDLAEQTVAVRDPGTDQEGALHFAGEPTVRRARDAGVQGRISGNSLRVGSAQSLTNAGATLAKMQSAGRWRSPVMPVRYAQEKRPQQGAVAGFRYGR